MDAQSDSKPSRNDNTALLAAIGARVRTERAKRGMTRRALAEQCQTSDRYLAQIEGGAGNPSVLVAGCSSYRSARETLPGSPSKSEAVNASTLPWNEPT